MDWRVAMGGSEACGSDGDGSVQPPTHRSCKSTHLGPEIGAQRPHSFPRVIQELRLLFRSEYNGNDK